MNTRTRISKNPVFFRLPNRLFDGIKISLGAGIFCMLLILSVVGFSIDPDEVERGPRNIPPLNDGLQRLLLDYEPGAESYNYFADDLLSIFGWDDGADDSLFDDRPESAHDENNGKTAHTGLNFESRPNVRAVAGRKYTYRIRTNTHSSATGCELISGPRGASVEDCVFTWLPVMQPSVTFVEVASYDLETGDGQRQSFELQVSELPFLLGTDNRGRDFLSLLFLSMKWVLMSGLIVSVVALAVGLPLGAYSGFYENRYSRFIIQAEQFLESIPFIILLFLVAVSSDFNILVVMAVVGLFMAPSISKIVYGMVYEMKKRNFVEAARELGVSNTRILWSEIIWHNGKVPLISQVCNLFAIALVLEVTLSYLQLGVQLPEMSLGFLLRQGSSQLLSGNYWLTVIPTLIIVTAVTGYYLIADGIETFFGVKGQSS